MLFFDGFFGVLMLGVWVFCIVDVITTDSVLVRNLPKLVWLMIVLLLPEIGSIAWLVAGHPWQQGSTTNLPYKGNPGRADGSIVGGANDGRGNVGGGNVGRGNYGRDDGAAPVRWPYRDRAGAASPAMPSSPDDDADFLAGLRARAEEQRRRAREQGDS